MSEHRVSGIPIVDDDRKLVGIVTEADLLRTEKEREPKRRSRFLEWFIDRTPLAQIERIAADLRARDLMTREVVTVEPQAKIREAMFRLLEAGVKRLPVVDPMGGSSESSAESTCYDRSFAGTVTSVKRSSTT